MSEFFGSESRQDQLKSVIAELHAGKSVKELKKEFSLLLEHMNAEEIADMEQSLINEGFPAEKILGLCEVHVDVFEDSLKKNKEQAFLSGHPVHTYREENKQLKKRLHIIEETLKRLKKQKEVLSIYTELEIDCVDLQEIEKHYQRKENQLFPKLEKTGFNGPTSVMWGKHDEIRALLKSFKSAVQAKANYKELKKSFSELKKIMEKMIFMEEKILLPTSTKRLAPEVWVEIYNEEKEIGFSWVTPGGIWDPGIALANIKSSSHVETSATRQQTVEASTHQEPLKADQAEIPLQEGALTSEQLNLMLKNLPFDLTFVDEKDTVRYYSAAEDRIFPRTPAIIGREVQKCHPPKSVHVVEEIVKAFKNKEKRSERFWLNFAGKMILITYFALYDDDGTYKGVLEVSQDITDIQKITGEKRLVE